MRLSLFFVIHNSPSSVSGDTLPGPRRRWLWWGGLLLMAISAGSGCIRVDASGDFAGAARTIAERNGAAQAYDPAADSLVQTRVQALLADGLTIDEAVSVALLNNPGLQSLFQSIGASRADVVQSGLMANPALFLSVKFPEGGGRSSLGLSFAQQLVDLWQIPVRKKVAEADLERTVSSVLDHAVQLAADVRVRCVHWLALERAEQIAVENLRLAEESLKFADVRLRAGETGPIDGNLVRSHVLEVQQILIGIRRDKAMAQLDLSAALGLVRWPDPWRLVDTLGASSAAVADAEALVQHAVGERFDVRMLTSRVQSAEAQLEREYLEIFPNFTLGLEAERKERRSLPGRNIPADTARASIATGTLTAPTIQSRGQRDLIRSQIVDALLGPSLQLTLPLWDQNQAQIAKTRFAVLQLLKEYESLLDRVAREVRQARIAVEAARELVAVFETHSLPQAKENLEILRTQYENGEQGIIVLIEAQEFLLQQSRAYVEALQAQALAVTELRRAVGGRLPSDIQFATPTSVPTDEKELLHDTHN